MAKRVVRIVLNEETFRKYKVFCAIANISMTDQTNEIIQIYVDDMSKTVKIINTSSNADKDSRPL